MVLDSSAVQNLFFLFYQRYLPLRPKPSNPVNKINPHHRIAWPQFGAQTFLGANTRLIQGRVTFKAPIKEARKY